MAMESLCNQVLNQSVNLFMERLVQELIHAALSRVNAHLALGVYSDTVKLIK